MGNGIRFEWLLLARKRLKKLFQRSQRQKGVTIYTQPT